VIGDSWSVGLGLASSEMSWPSRLPGEVHVAGFSGTGLSNTAGCAGESFAERAGAAVPDDASLVVVEGGLNDYDQPPAAIAAGFGRLMAALAGHRVVVVGPASAPSRADAIPRVDALLSALATTYGVGYVSTADLALPYLPDGLHLTAVGHRLFGDAVARWLSTPGGPGTGVRPRPR
jgi:acyl-CoA thioesterase-1